MYKCGILLQKIEQAEQAKSTVMYGGFCYNQLMKKIIFLILLVVLVGGFIYATRDPIPELGFDRDDDSRTFNPDPSNATFLFEDGEVILSQGKREEEESGITEEVTLLDNVAYGDVNDDNKNDAALFLAQYGGGSGTFIYAAVFVSGPVSYKGSNVVFLGDRISPQDIFIKNGVVNVEYLDRGPDERFSAEPTISVSKQFIYKNGVLEEK